LGQASKLTGADGIAGIGFGCRREHGADTHIVGSGGGRNLGVASNRGADDEPQRDDGAERDCRNVIHSDVHAGRSRRECHVCAIVHDHGHWYRLDERARDLHELPRIDVLETQLHHGCAASDRSRGAAHEAIGAVAEVIRDRDETENVGNRESGIGNRQTWSREREQGTEAACYVRDVPAESVIRSTRSPPHQQRHDKNTRNDNGNNRTGWPGLVG